jgi:hypothetical protein
MRFTHPAGCACKEPVRFTHPTREQVMSIQQWEIVIYVVTAALTATAPWMFMVHAKLAVLSTQVARLETKVDRMVDAEQERLPQCIQHETALRELQRRWEMHDVKIENVLQRIPS